MAASAVNVSMVEPWPSSSAKRFNAPNKPRVPSTAALSITRFVRGKAVEASLHETAERARKGRNPLAAVVAREQRGQLLEKERVAAAAVDELVHDLIGKRLADELVEQGGGRIATEGIEPQEHVVVLTDGCPACGLLLARGGEEHERERREVLDGPTEQIEHERVGPVQVGHDKENRTRPRAGVEIGEHRAADLLACARRVDDVERSAFDTEEREQTLETRSALAPASPSPSRAATAARHCVRADASSVMPIASRSAIARGHHTLGSP